MNVDDDSEVSLRQMEHPHPQFPIASHATQATPVKAS